MVVCLKPFICYSCGEEGHYKKRVSVKQDEKEKQETNYDHAIFYHPAKSQMVGGASSKKNKQKVKFGS